MADNKMPVIARITKSIIWLPLIITAGMFFAPHLEAKPLTVAVSILPQKYFVEQVAGDLAAVQVMIPPGASPASYEPRPSQMASLARCRIYFAIGVGFEKAWLEKFSAAGNLNIVHTDRGIEKVPLPRHFHPENHQQEQAGMKVHATALPDPHIWLSPKLVEIQAGHIAGALAMTDPQHAEIYRNRCKRFIQRLKILDNDLAGLLAPVKGAAFMVFHPSWGYFARAYGLVQIPIEIEGKQPKPAQLNAMIQWAANNRIKAVFVQPQFNRKTAELVANTIGARIIEADPLAYDWEANLRRQAQNFFDAIQ